MARAAGMLRERSGERSPAPALTAHGAATGGVPAPFELEPEAIGAQLGGEAPPPLDEHDGVGADSLQKPEVGKTRRVVEAVEVHVSHGDPPRQVVHQVEGGARDPHLGRHAEPASDGAGEERLAGAEGALEQNQVTRLKAIGEPAAEPTGVAASDEVHRPLLLGLHGERQVARGGVRGDLP